MNLNIIQWNAKGFNNNYLEIEVLIKKYSLKIITRQETHIKADGNPHQPPIRS